jgi:hypothetical protein
MSRDSRGRKKIRLTKEELMGAMKTHRFLKDAARELDVSYPTFLREKQRHGLDVVPEEETERNPHFERIEWDEDEFIEEMAKIDNSNPKTIGYNEFTYKFDESIILWYIADLHIGGETTEHKKIAEDIKKAKEYSNVKIILGGDLIDNFSKYSVGGGIYQQEISVTKQKEIAEWITKYLGKDKVLGVIQGCHEEWSYMNDGFDFAKYLSNKIGSVYLGKRALLTLNVGVNKYKVYCDHNSRWWSSFNICHGLKQTCRMNADFDLGFGAHRHVPNSENTLIRGKMVKTCKASSYKKPDRYIEKIKTPEAPILSQCYVMLAEPIKPYWLGIVYFEDIEHALRFL